MTPSGTVSLANSTKLHSEARTMFDCVYFLMFKGWSAELQANRWHWARRWSRIAPVVLVQPTQPRAPASLEAEPEPRLPNTRILYVKSQERGPQEASAATAAGQLAADLEAQGYERPLLWCYNPRLLEAYALLPAVARVYHATENHFQMDGLDDGFREELRKTIRLSDVSIAVSGGVAQTIAAEVPGAKVAEVTNGCDFAMYSASEPDPGLVATAGGRRTVVYAGNVNSRLDFRLLATAAGAYPADLFAFFGPVRGLGREDSRIWKELLRMSNVRHFGAVEPGRLPGIYAAADVGLLPYKATPSLVENGFPLKALEMAATGLPVVSTLLKPLRGLAGGIAVTSGDAEFVARIAMSRAALLAKDWTELVELARRNDYDVKFEAVVELVAGVAHAPEPPPDPGRNAAAIAAWSEHAWPRAATRAFAAGDRVRLAFSRLGLKLFPEPLRERVPGRVRGMVNRHLNPR